MSALMVTLRLCDGANAAHLTADIERSKKEKLLFIGPFKTLLFCFEGRPVLVHNMTSHAPQPFSPPFPPFL